MKTNVAIVIPNWNGKDRLESCLEAVVKQSEHSLVIVVDNGSTDESVKFVRKHFPQIDLIVHDRNLGFAGGVNSGIMRAKTMGIEYIALLNNDAVPEKDWLKNLYSIIRQDSELGAVACKLLSADKKHVDSTGDFYTIWGLPFNRDRDLPAAEAESKEGYVFGPCAGAALYRVSALEDAGLFDEDFFAYHEDADLHFRLQLKGWKTLYTPKAVAYHATGSTSKTIKGFTTYHTFKNYPILLIKNVPGRLLPSVLLRFTTIYVGIYINSLIQGRGWPATKGVVKFLALLPKKMVERRRIQTSKRVSTSYIHSILIHDLPPNVGKLRRLNRIFMK